MKKLYVLAPNDRFNYGDLLFPHIIKHYLSNLVDECVFVSTTESDLSKLGSIPTKSFKELYDANPKDENILIVAGGESLLVHWCLILNYVDSLQNRLYSLFKMVRLNKKCVPLLNFVAKRRWRFKTKYPFSIGKNELPAFSKVVYNSLGRCSLAGNDKPLKKGSVREILNSVDVLAVRDNLTYNALKKNGINCVLKPDSAVLMSDVFSEDFLKSSLSIDATLYNEKEYIFFQTSPLGSERECSIANSLKELCAKYQKKVVLCPIGTALGHNNQKALLNIYNQTPKELAVYVETPNVWDIMWLIKHSCLYVGTSLHGTITAMSFNVPFAVHGQPKVKAYIDTWSPDMAEFYSDFEGLKRNISLQLNVPKSSSCGENMKKISLEIIDSFITK